MFESGSFLRSLDIYLVENVVQSLAALALVLALVHTLKIRDHILRIQLYLLPIFLPLIAPPLYYLLFPSRPEMPVLKLDRLLALEKVIPYQHDGGLWGPILTLALVLALGLLLARGAVTVLAILLIPRHHRPFPMNKDSALQRALTSLAAKAGVRQPRVLLSENRNRSACSFALIGQSYLLLPPRWLEEHRREVLEPAIAHEIAHLKRGDHRLLPLLCFVRGLLFFNPAVHIAGSLIVREAELACDQMALKLGIEPVDYGHGLLRAWQMAPLCRVANGSGGKELRGRVEAILAPDLTLDRPRWVFPAVATVLGIAFFFLC
ncbi:MAG: M56 family metallopeptidase [Dehalococcoidia bacterium]|nr:M56 family metallopeptidase [Dehalococcoidia bacterium]